MQYRVNVMLHCIRLKPISQRIQSFNCATIVVWYCILNTPDTEPPNIVYTSEICMLYYNEWAGKSTWLVPSTDSPFSRPHDMAGIVSVQDVFLILVTP